MRPHHFNTMNKIPLSHLIQKIFTGDAQGSRMHDHGIRLFRYILVGLSNVALDFLIYIPLTRLFPFWRRHYLLANFLSFMIVITWSFFLNKHWTYQEKSKKNKTQYAKFLIITIAGLILYESILYVSIQFLSLYDLLAKILAIPIMSFWNFFMHRKWTFKKQDNNGNF